MFPNLRPGRKTALLTTGALATALTATPASATTPIGIASASVAATSSQTPAASVPAIAQQRARTVSDVSAVSRTPTSDACTTASGNFGRAFRNLPYGTVTVEAQPIHNDYVPHIYTNSGIPPGLQFAQKPISTSVDGSGVLKMVYDINELQWVSANVTFLKRNPDWRDRLRQVFNPDNCNMNLKPFRNEMTALGDRYEKPELNAMQPVLSGPAETGQALSLD